MMVLQYYQEYSQTNQYGKYSMQEGSIKIQYKLWWYCNTIRNTLSQTSMESIAGEQYKIQCKLQVTIPWYCNTICKVMTNQYGKYGMQEGSIRYSTYKLWWYCNQEYSQTNQYGKYSMQEGSISPQTAFHDSEASLSASNDDDGFTNCGCW